MGLDFILLLLASLAIVRSDQENGSCEVIEKSDNDILERIEKVEKKVESLKDVHDRIEKLSKITYDLSRSTGAATEKKMKMDVQ